MPHALVYKRETAPSRLLCFLITVMTEVVSFHFFVGSRLFSLCLFVPACAPCRDPSVRGSLICNHPSPAPHPFWLSDLIPGSPSKTFPETNSDCHWLREILIAGQTESGPSDNPKRKSN